MTPLQIEDKAANLVAKPAQAPDWDTLDYGPSLGPGLVYPDPNDSHQAYSEKPLGIVSTFIVTADRESASGPCSLNGDDYSFLSLSTSALVHHACTYPLARGKASSQRETLREACKAQFAADGYHHQTRDDFVECESVDFRSLLATVGNEAAASAGVPVRQHGMPTAIDVFNSPVTQTESVDDAGQETSEVVATSDAAVHAIITFARLPNSRRQLERLEISDASGRLTDELTWRG